MGESNDAIRWPSTENDLFWSRSLSPSQGNHRELRAARHRKEEVTRSQDKVQNIPSPSSNRLPLDPMEDLSFEAQACGAQSPRQEKDDPHIDGFGIGYNPVNGKLHVVENFCPVPALPIEWYRCGKKVLFRQACQTSITQDLCSAHRPWRLRRSTPKLRVSHENYLQRIR